MFAHDDSNFLKTCVSISLLSTCVAAPGAKVADGTSGHIGEEQSPCIRVLIINTARVPEDTVSVALDRAALIFRDAGVCLIWVGRAGSSLQQTAFPDSRSDSASTLVLRIVSRPISGLASPNALGFAVVAGEDSKYGSVFRDRVLAATRRGRYSEGMLMGHAIAHELGHLLLATSAHTRYGLMAGRWRTNELDRAEVGLLQFSPGEAARLRSESLRRATYK
jgi:hypothetical protein